MAAVNLPVAILAAMLSLQQPGASIYSLRHVEQHSPPGCDNPYSLLCAPPRYSPARKAWVRPETRAEGLERYWVIAREAATVACAGAADCSTPAVLTRAAKLVSTVHAESGFREDVHAGFARGDSGRSHCLGQIMTTGLDARVPWLEQVYGRDLVGTDREHTARCLEVSMLALERAGIAGYTGSHPSPTTGKRIAMFHLVLGMLPTGRITRADAVTLGLAGVAVEGEGNCVSCEEEL